MSDEKGIGGLLRELFDDLEKTYLNKIAELSIKINEMQSSLREFEKQKVDPIQTHVNEIDRYECHNRALIDELNERIQKLENQQAQTTDTIACVDLAYDEETEKLSERIEKLESIAHFHQPENPWYPSQIIKPYKEEKNEFCPHGVPAKFNTVINCALCNAILCGSGTLK